MITFARGWNEGTRTNLLGRRPSKGLVRSLSNELQVTPRTPPSFLWHTADDQMVPVANSLIFAEALSRNKVPFELHVFPHAPHGAGLATDNPVVGQWTALCAKWLVGLGF